MDGLSDCFNRSLLKPSILSGQTKTLYIYSDTNLRDFLKNPFFIVYVHYLQNGQC